MSEMKKYYRILGGPLKAAIEKKIELLQEQKKEAVLLGNELGAEQYLTTGLFESVIWGFKFSGPVPAGWIAPGRDGFTRPRKDNKEMSARLRALTVVPSDTKMVREITDIPLSFGYKNDEVNGATGIGGIEPCRFVYWPSHNIYALVVPDVMATLAAWEKEGYTITSEGIKDWVMPGVDEGLLEEISEKELNFMIAKAELDESRANKEAEELAS